MKDITIEYGVKGSLSWCNPTFIYIKGKGWYMKANYPARFGDGSEVQPFEAKNLKHWFTPGAVQWVRITESKVYERTRVI